VCSLSKSRFRRRTPNLQAYSNWASMPILLGYFAAAAVNILRPESDADRMTWQIIGSLLQ
jgi:hypothetical protein